MKSLVLLAGLAIGLLFASDANAQYRGFRGRGLEGRGRFVLGAGGVPVFEPGFGFGINTLAAAPCASGIGLNAQFGFNAGVGLGGFGLVDPFLGTDLGLGGFGSGFGLGGRNLGLVGRGGRGLGIPPRGIRRR